MKFISAAPVLLLICIAASAQKAFDGCPAAGSGKPNAKNPNGTLSAPKQVLNKLKNRDNAPNSITSSVTLEKKGRNRSILPWH